MAALSTHAGRHIGILRLDYIFRSFGDGNSIAFIVSDVLLNAHFAQIRPILFDIENPLASLQVHRCYQATESET